MKIGVLAATLIVAAITLVSCGSGGSNQTVITYELVPLLDPQEDRNGSLFGTKGPLRGPSGLRVDVGLEGSFDVVSDPPGAGVQLDYRVVRVDFVPLDPRGVGLDRIYAEGDDLGHLLLLDDGTLTMTLSVPMYGIDFDLGPNGISINRYAMDGDRLLLRGVRLNTEFDEPYYGTPLIFLWADPE